MILKMAKVEEDKAQLLLQGVSRFEITEYTEEKPYLQARVKELSSTWDKDKEIEALMANLVTQYQQIVELSSGLPPEIVSMAKSLEEPDILADMITSTINSTTPENKKFWRPWTSKNVSTR
ncbi:MAG: LON peptidase substrate-binding domain-containing protein [Desulfobacterales bacterium]